jgi:hypothetical protein
VTAAQILRAAAHELATKGWTQGRIVDLTTGALCAQGAIEVAALRISGQWGSPEHASAIVVLQDYLGEAIDLWNDRDGRDADQVVRALNAAADQCEPAEPLDTEQLQSGDDSVQIAEAWRPFIEAGLSENELRALAGDR